MTPTIQKDGKTFLIQPVCSQRDGYDDFEVVAVELSIELIASLRAKLDLADKLKDDYGIDGLSYVDYSAGFYQADYDEDPIEYDGEGVQLPDWDNQARTDGSRLIVQSGKENLGSVYWRVWAKYADYTTCFESYGLDRRDLDKLEKQLKELLTA